MAAIREVLTRLPSGGMRETVGLHPTTAAVVCFEAPRVWSLYLLVPHPKPFFLKVLLLRFSIGSKSQVHCVFGGPKAVGEMASIDRG